MYRLSCVSLIINLLPVLWIMIIIFDKMIFTVIPFNIRSLIKPHACDHASKAGYRASQGNKS